MTITSFSYLAFLAVVFTVYYLIRPKWQSGYLLAVSLVFYCLAGRGIRFFICSCLRSASIMRRWRSTGRRMPGRPDGF